MSTPPFARSLPVPEQPLSSFFHFSAGACCWARAHSQVGTAILRLLQAVAWDGAEGWAVTGLGSSLRMGAQSPPAYITARISFQDLPSAPFF